MSVSIRQGSTKYSELARDDNYVHLRKPTHEHFIIGVRARTSNLYCIGGGIGGQRGQRGQSLPQKNWGGGVDIASPLEKLTG